MAAAWRAAGVAAAAAVLAASWHLGAAQPQGGFGGAFGGLGGLAGAGGAGAGGLAGGGLAGGQASGGLGGLGGGLLGGGQRGPTGLGGFGGPPGGGGLAGAGAPLGGAPPSSGMGGAPQLPTMNLLNPGGILQGGGSQTPQNIQQLQAQAVQDSRLDNVCPGRQRQSVDVGADCWRLIWTSGGCSAENVPQYEPWHQAQTLEVLVADVVQWANLPDDRHKQGCYGSQGPPANEPPPSPLGGLGAGGLGLGGGGLGSGALGGGMGGGMGLGGGLAQGGPPPQPQSPPPPPEVVEKLTALLQSPELPNVCPGHDPQAPAVGEACWKKIWTYAGCLQDTAPAYEEWHHQQTLEVLVVDAAQWASLPSEVHRKACYGAASATAHPEL